LHLINIKIAVDWISPVQLYCTSSPY